MPENRSKVLKERLSPKWHLFLEHYNTYPNQLLQVFKGGSNSLTFLAHDERGPFVRKTAFIPDGAKLEYQYHWLQKMGHLVFTPQVLGLHKDEHTVSLDLVYYASYQPLFDFIHRKSKVNPAILEDVLEALFVHIHQSPKPAGSLKTLESYIRDKAYNKITECQKTLGNMAELLEPDEINVNGKTLLNFYPILNRIVSNRKVMKLLSEFSHCNIHGDLTIENILIDNDRFLFLDPNNENSICDPVVDFAKLFQSLRTGYEFLLREKSVVRKNNEILFTSHRSVQYQTLFHYLEGKLQNQLSQQQLLTLKFHEAIHYCRLLPYRGRQNPETFAIFYATMVRLFNEFSRDTVS